MLLIYFFNFVQEISSTFLEQITKLPPPKHSCESLYFLWKRLAPIENCLEDWEFEINSTKDIIEISHRRIENDKLKLNGTEDRLDQKSDGTYQNLLESGDEFFQYYLELVDNRVEKYFSSVVELIKLLRKSEKDKKTQFLSYAEYRLPQLIDRRDKMVLIIHEMKNEIDTPITISIEGNDVAKRIYVREKSIERLKVIQEKLETVLIKGTEFKANLNDILFFEPFI